MKKILLMFITISIFASNKYNIPMEPGRVLVSPSMDLELTGIYTKSNIILISSDIEYQSILIGSGISGFLNFGIGFFKDDLLFNFEAGLKYRAGYLVSNFIPLVSFSMALTPMLVEDRIVSNFSPTIGFGMQYFATDSFGLEFSTAFKYNIFINDLPDSSSYKDVNKIDDTFTVKFALAFVFVF